MSFNAQVLLNNKDKDSGVVPFHHTLSRYGLTLLRDKTTTLQISIGLRCTQACKHCFLEASPSRTEEMSRETIDRAIDFARKGHFETIEITGGAPELHPDLGYLFERLSTTGSKLIMRSNLTALFEKWDALVTPLKEYGVAVFASFPSMEKGELEYVRGRGSFQTSVKTLKKLNALGYGNEGSGLELDLVVNPPGPTLLPSQAEIENRFHEVLFQRWGILFNRIICLANVPLGRFRNLLIEAGEFENYMKKLESAFNRNAVSNLMCRTTLLISWDGYLYDCGFNQVVSLFMGNRKRHVSDMQGLPDPGNSIAAGNHCYACTALAGFR